MMRKWKKKWNSDTMEIFEKAVDIKVITVVEVALRPQKP